MENNQNNRNQPSNKFLISACIFVLLCALVNIYQISYTINLIKDKYHKMELELFKKMILYKGLFDIYKEFHFLILILDLIYFIISSLEFNNLYQTFFQKLNRVFIFFNYLFFGPFLFGVVILCMKYGNELTFIYDPKEKANVGLHHGNIFIIFIYILISFTVAIIAPIFYSFKYFDDSIKFKRYGNFLLGKIFWHFALKYFDGFNHIINNENEGVNNNAQEIQNNIFPIDDYLLLDNMID